MVICLGLWCTNNMPRIGGSERTNIKPCACREGVLATHTSKSRLFFLPVSISSLTVGKLASSSSWPACANARGIDAQASSSASNTSGNAGRREDSGLVARHMAVIFAEFDATCEIEAGEDHPFAAAQAGRGAETEAARHHPINRVRTTQGLDALLGELVHGAL